MLPILLGVGAALVFWLNGMGVVFDFQISDLHLHRFGTRFKPSPEVVLLTVDDASLQLMEPRVGRWPWPRSLIARLIASCEGARAVGVDILFAELDRAHPAEDPALSDALRRNKRVVLAGVFVDDLVREDPGSPDGAIQRSLLPVPEHTPVQRLVAQFLAPAPPFADAANRLGHASFIPSPDRILRSYSYVMTTDRGWMPSLAVATLLAQPSEAPSIEDIRDSPPVKRASTTELLFHHEPFMKIRAVDVLSGNTAVLPPRWAEGRIVLVGVEAKGLHDRRATPISGSSSGLEIHATAMSNWLQKTWVRSFRPSVVLLLSCLAALVPVLFWNNPLPTMLFRWALCLLGYACVGIMAFHFLALRVPWTCPFAGFVGTSLGALISISREERARRRRIEELEQLRRSLGNMLLHDLRAPLGSVIMLLESILPSQPEDSKTRRRIVIAVGEATRLNTMLQSLLEIQRMESGRMELRRTQFDWGAFTREILGRFQPRAEKLHLKLENPAADSGLRVEADRELLARVFTNLLDNAIKFATPGTNVLCESWMIAGAAPSLKVRVSNHGPVLDPTMQSRVFEMWAQGSGTSNREGTRGLGLGLAYCKLAIVAHGGMIVCRSPVPGWEDGVLVEFEIPMPPPEARPVET